MLIASDRLKALPDRHIWQILLALFLASVLIRTAFLIGVTGLDHPLEGDQPIYHGKAVSMLDGKGLGNPGSQSNRPPLISFQLLLVYLFTGPSTTAARWTMVFYSSLVTPLLFLMARKLLGCREHIALIVAAAWALYPPSIWYATRPLAETTAALLVVGSLGAFLLAARANGGMGPVVLTGALWALASLNRSSYLLMPAALLAAQLVISRFGPIQWGWSRRHWALGLLVFVLVLSPWTIRNYLLHGIFLPIESRTGYVLVLTNGTLDHPATQAGAYYKNRDLLSVVDQGESEVERDVILRRLVIDEIRENWRLLPQAVFNRAKNFWTTRPDPYDPLWTRNDWVMLFIWGPVLFFFLTSSFVRSWRQYWPALAIILYAFLLTLPFWGTPRFRFPVDALIITGAVLGFYERLSWLKSVLRRIRRKPDVLA